MKKFIHEEEDKYLFTANNIKYYMRIYCNKIKVDDYFHINTTEGIKKWVSTKYTMNDIDDITDDNKITWVSKEISSEKCKVIFATKNLLKLLSKENTVAYCNSTHNCMQNR